MTIKWGSCVGLICLLSLLMGCRTPQPNLKPPKTPEVLTMPPDLPKFATPAYPAQAFDRPDANRTTNLDQAIQNVANGRTMTGAGSGGGPGMTGGGGMPGSR